MSLVNSFCPKCDDATMRGCDKVGLHKRRILSPRADDLELAKPIKKLNWVTEGYRRKAVKKDHFSRDKIGRCLHIGLGEKGSRAYFVHVHVQLIPVHLESEGPESP